VRPATSTFALVFSTNLANQCDDDDVDDDDDEVEIGFSN